MAWTASGLYSFAMAALLGGTGGAVTADSWLLTSNKFFLTNNSDTPAYGASLASSIYSVTNEVSGTGWAAGGIAVSALGASATSIAPSFVTVAGPPAIIEWQASNIAVSGTTLSSIFGGYFYQPATTVANSKIIGIYFGGTSYATVSGVLGVTWSSSNIATIQLQ